MQPSPRPLYHRQRVLPFGRGAGRHRGEVSKGPPDRGDEGKVREAQGFTTKNAVTF